MGHPERMGIAHAWTVEKFLEKSTTVLPSGRVYQNLCIGCDAFHEEVVWSGRQSWCRSIRFEVSALKQYFQRSPHGGALECTRSGRERVSFRDHICNVDLAGTEQFQGGLESPASRAD